MRGALHITRAFFVLALFHLNAFAASFQPGYWDSRFNPISGRPTVDIAADDNRRLLVWGQNLPVSIPLPGSVSIARWDGFRWEVLAKGTSPATILARGDQVFAAGKFASISGVPAANIAVYENGAWSSLAQGVNSNVTSIALFGTNLIAGGNFTQAGSVQTPFIAQWNGARWAAMGSGLTGVVARVTTSAQSVYAAWIAGSGMTVSEWSGSDWQPIGTFSMGDGTSANIHALAFVSGALVAGGRFNSIDGQSITNIARWDGAAWTQLAAGALHGQIENVAAIDQRLFGAGDLFEITGATTNRFALAEITESAFSKELDGQAQIGRTVTSIGSELFVATQPFLPSIPADQNFFYDTFGLIWHHNGDDWGLVSNIPQFPPLFHDLAESPEGLVGTISPRPGDLTNPIIWTGNRFDLTEIDPPTDGARIAMKSLLVQQGSSVYAQATRTKTGEPARDLLMSLTNGVWYAASSPIDGQMTALGLYNGKIAAAIRTFDTVEHWNIWLWDGGQWTTIGGDFDGYVNALVSFNGELYAGGRAVNSGVLPVNRLARFNGTTWNSVGDGVTAPFDPLIITLVSDDRKLYVGGFFQQASGIQATNLATWDGTNWAAMPGLTNGDIKTIAFSADGLLAVAGSFRYIDGLDAGGIALWDGSHWTTLGTNVGQITGLNIIRLLWRGHDLFAAGSFTSFDGILSQNFGIWHHPGVILNVRPTPPSVLSVTTTGAVPKDFSLEATDDFITWSSLGTPAIGNDRPWALNPAKTREFVRARFGSQ